MASPSSRIVLAIASLTVLSIACEADLDGSSASSDPPTTSVEAGSACDPAAMSADLSAEVEIVRDTCEGDWALVGPVGWETMEGGSDGWRIIRREGAGWTVFTGFPTQICEAQVAAAGAPDAVVSAVLWPC